MSSEAWSCLTSQLSSWWSPPSIQVLMFDTVKAQAHLKKLDLLLQSKSLASIGSSGNSPSSLSPSPSESTQRARGISEKSLVHIPCVISHHPDQLPSAFAAKWKKIPSAWKLISDIFSSFREKNKKHLQVASRFHIISASLLCCRSIHSRFSKTATGDSLSEMNEWCALRALSCDETMEEKFWRVRMCSRRACQGID